MNLLYTTTTLYLRYSLYNTFTLLLCMIFYKTIDKIYPRHVGTNIIIKFYLMITLLRANLAIFLISVKIMCNFLFIKFIEIESRNKRSKNKR